MDFDKTPQEYSIIGEGVGPSFDSNDVYVCVADDLKGLTETVRLHRNMLGPLEVRRNTPNKGEYTT